MGSGLKSQFSPLAIVLALVCLFLLYVWVDCRVTIEHARLEQEYRGKSLLLMQTILEATGGNLSRSELQRAKAKLGRDHVVKEDGNLFHIDEVTFKYSGETFVGISYLNDPRR